MKVVMLTTDAPNQAAAVVLSRNVPRKRQPFGRRLAPRFTMYGTTPAEIKTRALGDGARR